MYPIVRPALRFVNVSPLAYSDYLPPMMPPFRTVLAVVEQLGQLTHPCRIVVISMYAERAEIARFHALNV